MINIKNYIDQFGKSWPTEVSKSFENNAKVDKAKVEQFLNSRAGVVGDQKDHKRTTSDPPMKKFKSSKNEVA